MSKATAIYVRVSHRDQSHASQMPDLERWAQAHDGKAVVPGQVHRQDDDPSRHGQLDRIYGPGSRTDSSLAT